jgi:hypothetical protein
LSDPAPEKPRLVVDSDWKEQAERDKERLARDAAPPPGRDLPPADFTTHAASLATQALIFMGAIANPITGKADIDFDQARYIIDTLGMLRDKTKGNLTADEQETIDNVLGELKLVWLQVSAQANSSKRESK